MFHPLLPVEAIRAAEEGVIASDSFPDETMQKAATAVADTVQWLSTVPGVPGNDRAASAGDNGVHGLPGLPQEKPSSPVVIIVAGSGGNGGDALYAGAVLVQRGWHAVAVCVGSSVHERARRAFEKSGGIVVGKDGETEEADLSPDDLAQYRARFSSCFLIDGVTGIGGHGPLRDEPATWIAAVADAGIPVVAVDIPSGIDADTGIAHTPHVVAAATVTFGAFRRAHAMNSDCGVVLQADCGLRDACRSECEKREADGETIASGVRAVTPPDIRQIALPDGIVTLAPDKSKVRGMSSAAWPAMALEPGAHDDKYTGGVVGVRAGSPEYPGAAVLCTTAAVRATSAMVRFAGKSSDAVVAAHPEIVAADDIASSGRVQAWVVGPGGGVERNYDDLHDLLCGSEGSAASKKCPILIDADGLTALCQWDGNDSGSEAFPLIRAVKNYDGAVILTPHQGEFRRVVKAVLAEPSVELSSEEREALTDVPNPDSDYPRIPAVSAVARALHCVVLLKGRSTVVAAPSDSSSDTPADASSQVKVCVVDAGCSWAATPGSGDVLSGLAGALVAESVGHAGLDAELPLSALMETVVRAAVIHASAANIAAETEDGYAPTSASVIAEAIPRARARLQM
ncbi:NAD(P)H-hydrate epimerase [Corynebacterium pseudokroppenstedtii]|uniref:ADP-dependent (S)-NAD(P)H-hydrate dehydratase n=1 Tax=Corynebacterium pseudokroppenstedtii TaxID=2804917 RepID=A0AAU0PY45_9CORY|nr:bifunctional ADP-dependent NAD(P)H-hydrate dehydratase/NAD(P)H-hydrate epimerase [Corynebacterium pseudokroppenstedtii]MCF8703379.1 bifunctional ADP-dependent NAD(P)H-hydrate dehydratase/NAD(P)H-hydrate epimerase [Corynebacterium pseudokroppenstedtii]MCG2637084.1 bifunctional ADP-dependent NAD(P)H-hydrate dehydratase/NAD(P)H-hydrate epimerase [Corynebacterium pseudokroppenstedtii]